MKYLFILLFAACVTAASSQTPYSFTQATDTYANVEQISLANPWVGARLSYNLNEDAPLDENFLFSAKVLYTPAQGENFAIPIVGTAGLNSTDLFNPESGVNIGVYPYYIFSKSETLTLIAHGGMGYKVITKDVEVGDETPQQVRLVGGVEVALFPESGGLPTTLSVTPVYLINTGTNIDNTGVLEITGIVPVANGVGLIAEGLVPFKDALNGSFRFGIIVRGQL